MSLYEVFVKFGPIARLVLDTLHRYRHRGARLSIWKQTLPRQITAYEPELDTKISNLVLSDIHAFTTSEWAVDTPHAVVLVLPASLDEDDMNPHCSIAHTLALASAYIGHKLGHAVGGSVLRELQLQYTFDLFNRVPQSFPSAGWILRGIMHSRRGYLTRG